jgi:hypothetical protein
LAAAGKLIHTGAKRSTTAVVVVMVVMGWLLARRLAGGGILICAGALAGRGRIRVGRPGAAAIGESHHAVAECPLTMVVVMVAPALLQRVQQVLQRAVQHLGSWQVALLNSLV